MNFSKDGNSRWDNGSWYTTYLTLVHGVQKGIFQFPWLVFLRKNQTDF